MSKNLKQRFAHVLRTETESDLMLSDDEIEHLSDRLVAATRGHVAETGCNLTFEDFADENDEPCVDGGMPIEHPSEGEA